MPDADPPFTPWSGRQHEKPQSATPSSTAPGEHRSNKPAEPGHGATVIVVDDYEANVLLLKRILSRRPDVAVLVESDGRRGLDLIRQHMPDLVLLDLGLPTMDGETVLRAIRAEPKMAGLPVVVLSGDATAATSQRLHEAGATAYFAKPYPIQAILDAVNNALPKGTERD